MSSSFGHSVKVKLSSSLWHALQERCQQTGESIDYVIQMALADTLDIEHHTLFQVSTSTALVQGVYTGCVSVKDIKQHGNFGLGTFDQLDGEGIMLGGEIWQAKSDGSLHQAADDILTPFWITVTFVPSLTVELASVTNWHDLGRQIDAHRHSQNTFTAICIKGDFEHIQYRVACKTKHGTDLVTATSNQTVFEVNHCAGMLVGFWTPTYVKTLGIPGYHLHLLSDDRQYGGHVLNVSGSNLKLELMEENYLKIALPETAAFLNAQLDIDPSQALAKAEGA